MRTISLREIGFGRSWSGTSGDDAGMESDLLVLHMNALSTIVWLDSTEFQLKLVGLELQWLGGCSEMGRFEPLRGSCNVDR